MKRRTLLGTAGFAALAGAQSETSREPAILELTYMRMRNTTDDQSGRTREFVSEHVAPALRQAGSGPVGLFSVSVGSGNPTLVVLTSYPSLAGYEETLAAITENDPFVEAAMAYYGNPDLVFQRVEKSLLKGFTTFPDIEVPPTEPDRPARIFEIREYESDDFQTLARKIRMFESGEIDIFRRLGMLPVFFGRTIVGPRMPNLTYMLSFDSLAAREEKWREFVRDPEWRKISSQPGVSDAEIVSNINNTILSPVAGSDIR